jgi:hypothetical protein
MWRTAATASSQSQRSPHNCGSTRQNPQTQDISFHILQPERNNQPQEFKFHFLTRSDGTQEGQEECRLYQLEARARYVPLHKVSYEEMLIDCAVMKSGKVTLGAKSTLKSLRSGKAKLVIVRTSSNNATEVYSLKFADCGQHASSPQV